MKASVFNAQESAALVAAFDAHPDKEDENKSPAFYKDSWGVRDLPMTLYHVGWLTRMVQQKVPGAKFSNTYTREYRPGSVLKPHTDRPGLDLTLSVCLEKPPGLNWPLWVGKKPWPYEDWRADVVIDEYVKDGTPIDLDVGEGTIMQGRQSVHWRDPLVCAEGQRAVYVFYHWTLPQAAPTPEPVPHFSVGTANTAADVSFSSTLPSVQVLDNLLTPAECVYLIELASSKLTPSNVVDNSTGESVAHPARTSSGASFTRGEDLVIAAIEARISMRVGKPIENGEGMQVLRYGVGDEYKPHYDYFDPATPGSAKHTASGGQRVMTVLMYLNTPLLGGATVFPDAGLEIGARQGRALVFSYDQPSPTTKTLHGGAPVLLGEKWVMTKWFRTNEWK